MYHQCLLCKKEFAGRYSLRSLSTHVRRVHHMELESYYNEYLSHIENSNPVCSNPYCNSTCSFYNLDVGYAKYCSTRCISIGRESWNHSDIEDYKSEIVNMHLKNKLSPTDIFRQLNKFSAITIERYLKSWGQYNKQTAYLSRGSHSRSVPKSSEFKENLSKRLTGRKVSLKTRELNSLAAKKLWSNSSFRENACRSNRERFNNIQTREKLLRNSSKNSRGKSGRFNLESDSTRFDSTWECVFYYKSKYISKNDSLRRCDIRVPYIRELTKTKHYYTPDFIDSNTIYEVKPKYLLSNLTVLEKYEATKKELGNYIYKFITEDEIFVDHDYNSIMENLISNNLIIFD